MDWNGAYGVRTWFLIEPLSGDISEVTETGEELAAYFDRAVEERQKAKEASHE